MKTLTQSVINVDSRLNKVESEYSDPLNTVSDVQQSVPRYQNQFSNYIRPPYRTPRRFMNRPNRNYNNTQNRTEKRQAYQQSSSSFQGNCYKCGGQGHRQWECQARGQPRNPPLN